MVTYIENGKYAFFLNDKYTRDDSTGYYLSSKSFDGERKRLHIAVWEHFNGIIPSGYQIHHKDFNKRHNEIDNLQLKTIHDHLSLHAKLKDKKQLDKFQQAGIKVAPIWHASKEGHEWHKQHYEQMKNKMHKRIKTICQVCGKEYLSPGRLIDKFCSNNCKSAYRRKSGVDNEERICKICGEIFITNKYSKAKVCSKKCSAISRIQTMQSKVC